MCVNFDQHLHASILLNIYLLWYMHLKKKIYSRFREVELKPDDSSCTTQISNLLRMKGLS